MKIKWLGVLCVVGFCMGATDSLADEFLWKLSRIDSDSVTLIGDNEARKIAKIEKNDRPRLAPFLGKSVKVRFQDLKGEQWVVKLESWK